MVCKSITTNFLKLQSRVEKQAFQDMELLCKYLKFIETEYEKHKLQSRVEKQAFQEKWASHCIPMATSIVFFEYKQKIAQNYKNSS